MITQAEQDAFDFYFNAAASLAKTVAFRSLAIQLLRVNERISAVVSAYYSLFHLAITLIYLCPDKIDIVLLDKLRAKRGGGAIDPSNLITHKSALEFVQRCVQNGLDNKFFLNLDYAKNLREFVNYGPRITINNETPYFGPCNYTPSDCDKLVWSLDEIIFVVLEWACNNSPLKGALAKSIIGKCYEFFTENDLFYTRWCSRASIESCLKLIENLEQKYVKSQV